MGKLHLLYTWAPPPKRGEEASRFYRMRMMTLRLWDSWSRLTLFQEWAWKDEEGKRWNLDGTNNATARLRLRR